MLNYWKTCRLYIFVDNCLSYFASSFKNVHFFANFFFWESYLVKQMNYNIQSKTSVLPPPPHPPPPPSGHETFVLCWLCWASVVDNGKAVNQHWVSVSYLMWAMVKSMGRQATFSLYLVDVYFEICSIFRYWIKLFFLITGPLSLSMDLWVIINMAPKYRLVKWHLTYVNG